MSATPITIAECDALLEKTHARYLRAMARLSHIQQDDLNDTEDGDAAELPQQRTPSD